MRGLHWLRAVDNVIDAIGRRGEAAVGELAD